MHIYFLSCFIHASIHPSFHPLTHPSTHLIILSSIHPFIHLSHRIRTAFNSSAKSAMPLKTSVEETRCLEVVGEAERWLSRIKKLQQVIDCDSDDDCNGDGCDGGSE